MAVDTDALQWALYEDLAGLDERLADEEFCTELYRGLASRIWRRDGGAEGHIALSWSRAESLVNGLRRAKGHHELTLAQTGGEGEASQLIETELQRLGWHSAPLNTSRRDPHHAGQPEESEPPGDHQPPVWEREAHEQATRNRVTR